MCFQQEQILSSRDPLKTPPYLEGECTSSELKITAFSFRKTQGEMKDTEDAILSNTVMCPAAIRVGSKNVSYQYRHCVFKEAKISTSKEY